MLLVLVDSEDSFLYSVAGDERSGQLFGQPHLPPFGVSSTVWIAPEDRSLLEPRVADSASIRRNQHANPRHDRIRHKLATSRNGPIEKTADFVASDGT